MTVTVKNKKPSAVKKAAKGKQKAEKIFHPESRKAGQIQRDGLRKQKLANQLVKRNKKQMAQADRYAFFLHALPPEVPCLTLEELHGLVKDVWLTRHDPSLQKERSLRRPGRPKSSKEDQLEEWKRQDAEEYRTGLDLPDLLDQHNVGLFRQWDGVDVNYLNILKFIRISADFPETVHVARIGRDKNPTHGAAASSPVLEEDEEMDSEDALAPFSGAGSTILSMDEIR